MEKGSDSSTPNTKPENTRCGGEDDVREASNIKKTPPEKQEVVQRGTPEHSRSSPR